MQKFALLDTFLIALWVVALTVTLFSSVMYLFFVPYWGFTVSPTTGKVVHIFVQGDAVHLLPGTRLKQIDVVDEKICVFEKFWDCSPKLFWIAPDTGLRLKLEDGKIIDWMADERTIAEFLERFSGLWLGAVIFCVGGGVLIFKGLLQNFLERLLLLQSSLWALVLIGLVWMQSGMSWGGILFTLGLWLLAPTYFQFHWIFPLPLGRLPRAFWAGLYVLAIFLGVGVVWQQPQSIWWNIFPAFLIAAGNLLLLVAQWSRNATRRSTITGMLFTWALGLPVTLAVGSVVTGEPFVAWETLLLLLCITPMVNLITLYRHSANPITEQFVRHLSISTFAVLFLGGVSAVLGWLQPYFRNTDVGPGGRGLVITGVMVLAHWGYVRLDKLLKQFYLGIYEFPAKTLTEFGWAIAMVHTTAEVAGVLRNYIFDPMRISQAVIFVHNGQEAQPLLQIDVTDDDYPPLEVVTRWLEMQYLPAPEDVSPLWVRKVLALRNNDRLVGLCCLGKRTPENLYYTAEIQPMMRLLNQAVMVWTNLELTRNLREHIQNNLTLQEQQRLSLARDLHDSVLGELGLLRRSTPDAGDDFIKAYNQTVARIREIISGLHPNMLNYGLHTALLELADDPIVQIQVQNPVPIEVTVPQSAERYPETVELQIYRIVQQACQNACRHAAPSKIVISGELLPDSIELRITDDGKGIGETRPVRHGSVPSERRFGIHGMYERAMLIGANLHVGRNQFGKGTEVTLEWYSERAQPKT